MTLIKIVIQIVSNCNTKTEVVVMICIDKKIIGTIMNSSMINKGQIHLIIVMNKEITTKTQHKIQTHNLDNHKITSNTIQSKNIQNTKTINKFYINLHNHTMNTQMNFFKIITDIHQIIMVNLHNDNECVSFFVIF